MPLRDDTTAGEPRGLPASLWADVTPPGRPAPALSGDADADVVVIGAGFAGSAAALRLAEAGRKVVVLEASEPGWGASGRNNGQVIPGLKFDPDEIELQLGTERGARMARWAGALPDRVFELIAAHRIDCEATRTGWIQPTLFRDGAARIAGRCAQWAARGAPVEGIDRTRLAGLLGTDAFVAGWIDHRGGTINPLAYARGLAAAAVAAGARLHTNTFVTGLAHNGSDWRVVASGGSVRARHVFVATAAYANEVVPGLRRSMIPVRTAQVASEPLSARQLSTILPGRQGASDTRRLLTSFRIAAGNRLMMGGAWATGGLRHDTLLPHLHRSAARLFGHLGPLGWAYGWSGFFAATPDHLPHLHESPDGLYCALGCNGRGIGLSTGLGQLVAERILGRPAADLEIPVQPIRPVALHAFRRLGIAAATRMNRLRDRIDGA